MAKGSIQPSKIVFFIDNVPYKKIKSIPADDLLVVVNLQTHKQTAFVLTAVRHKIQKAWSATAVANMFGRSGPSVREVIANGHVKIHGVTYLEDEPSIINRYWLTKEDVLNIHEHFRTVKGTAIPTKDGLWRKAQKVPSRTELVRMMDSGVTSYIKTKSGEFIPAFLAPD